MFVSASGARGQSGVPDAFLWSDSERGTLRDVDEIAQVEGRSKPPARPSATYPVVFKKRSAPLGSLTWLAEAGSVSLAASSATPSPVKRRGGPTGAAQPVLDAPHDAELTWLPRADLLERRIAKISLASARGASSATLLDASDLSETAWVNASLLRLSEFGGVQRPVLKPSQGDAGRGGRAFAVGAVLASFVLFGGGAVLIRRE